MGRLYILCSDKLDPIYAAVQGGHAAVQFVLDQQEGIDNHNRSVFSEDKWWNDYIVYLSVDIKEWKEYLNNFDHLWYYYSEWPEPDMDNEVTAIALHIPDDCIDFKTKHLNDYEHVKGLMVPAHRELLRKLKKERLLKSNSVDEEIADAIENPRE